MKQIMGYSDKISVRPGETIKFMVSCEKRASYKARVVQIIHGDTNPGGPGYKERAIESAVDGTYEGRKQHIHAGSYAVIRNHRAFDRLSSFSIQAMIWPTTPEKAGQTLISRWSGKSKAGFILSLGGSAGLTLTLGDGAGGTETIETGKPLLAREWYFVGASFDAGTEVRLYQEPLVSYAKVDTASTMTQASKGKLKHATGAPLIFAAASERQLITAGWRSPGITTARSTGRGSRTALQPDRDGAGPRRDHSCALQNAVVAAWDFSADIPSETIVDASPNRLHGRIVNLPARAMTGWNWTGEDMDWTQAPEQYGAIHFHDDDLYDAGWEPDFSLTVPDGSARAASMRRVLRRPRTTRSTCPSSSAAEAATRRAKIALPGPDRELHGLRQRPHGVERAAREHAARDWSTACSQQDHLPATSIREYGLLALRHATRDGSGVCYSSRLRPILNMRPKSVVAGRNGSHSGSSMPTPTSSTGWRRRASTTTSSPTRICTTRGSTLLKPYRGVITGTHPEYYSTRDVDAMEAYHDRGGRLMYLGANGLYWRIAYHPTQPGVIEVRRAEGGIRAWAAEPGEYYQSFTGEYGGLWRRQGRPPQMLVGTGFTAQGFDVSSYYRRSPDSFDPRAAFIFEGVGKDELIGDFGLIGGGAAGLETRPRRPRARHAAARPGARAPRTTPTSTWWSSRRSS